MHTNEDPAADARCTSVPLQACATERRAHAHCGRSELMRTEGDPAAGARYQECVCRRKPVSKPQAKRRKRPRSKCPPPQACATEHGPCAPPKAPRRMPVATERAAAIMCIELRGHACHPQHCSDCMLTRLLAAMRVRAAGSRAQMKAMQPRTPSHRSCCCRHARLSCKLKRPSESDAAKHADIGRAAAAMRV